jgi:ribosomal protein L5
MKKENFTYTLNRFKEEQAYNQPIHALSIFPHINVHASSKIYKTVLNFSLRDVDFNKKKALPFFLAMELITNQKCVATLSSKNILI